MLTASAHSSHVYRSGLNLYFTFAVHPAAGIFDVAGKRETVSADKTTPGKYEGWALVTRRGTDVYRSSCL